MPLAHLDITTYGVSAFGLIMGRRSLAGSAIGGIAETQEMLDFCGAHNITAKCRSHPHPEGQRAYERLAKKESSPSAGASSLREYNIRSLSRHPWA